MGIRDIEVFRAVMTAGTTSKAAGLLGISQPAVSQSIRKLEASADLRLFERVRGRLVPTREAVALMSEVDRYFVGIEAIEHRIRGLKSYGVGNLAVAVMPALGTGFLPRVIGAFNGAEKGLQISLQIMSSREVHEKVSAGLVDFGLMSDELSMAGLEHFSFAKLPGVAVMHAKHPLARKSIIEPTDLSQVPFIALNPEDSARRRLEALLATSDVRLKTVVETPYAHTVCELALNGVGIGIVNPIVAIDFIGRGLVIKPLAVHAIFSSVVIFRPGVPQSESTKQFLRQMRVQLLEDQAVLDDALEEGGATPTSAKRISAKSSAHRRQK
ncbi:DNA-binding transcriptional LysR family regulator [Paraburkholderia sp. BL6669N2]|uniref:LysR substrate-binding domain-containing protein n=1 Tax=Paraburkholderia sp. BL6669N2 TaxID=1938807 RepID=UPI000E27623D|nr:LysR substrate-binding domain-containing protein [Paraburkholderia sp. BL6669N2]REG49613.1 DNA-binding transcriptional LysR family regulator [Paraburkholderia sp. BL6669N2]